MMEHHEQIRRQLWETAGGLSTDTLNKRPVPRLTASDESVWSRSSMPHPVFGLMDAAQRVDFIGIHEERRLAQLKELLSLM